MYKGIFNCANNGLSVVAIMDCPLKRARGHQHCFLASVFPRTSRCSEQPTPKLVLYLAASRDTTWWSILSSSFPVTSIFDLPTKIVPKASHHSIVTSIHSIKNTQYFKANNNCSLSVQHNVGYCGVPVCFWTSHLHERFNDYFNHLLQSFVLLLNESVGLNASNDAWFIWPI